MSTFLIMILHRDFFIGCLLRVFQMISISLSSVKHEAVILAQINTNCDCNWEWKNEWLSWFSLSSQINKFQFVNLEEPVQLLPGIKSSSVLHFLAPQRWRHSYLQHKLFISLSGQTWFVRSCSRQMGPLIKAVDLKRRNYITTSKVVCYMLETHNVRQHLPVKYVRDPRKYPTCHIF